MTTARIPLYAVRNALFMTGRLSGIELTAALRQAITATSEPVALASITQFASAPMRLAA